MRVNLISYTGHGIENGERHAASILLFAAGADFGLSRLDEIEALGKYEAEFELEKLATKPQYHHALRAIRYTFLVEGASRAFAHMLKNIMHDSLVLKHAAHLEKAPYWGYVTGPTIKDNAKQNWIYKAIMVVLARAVNTLLGGGAAPQDAKLLMPMGMKCNVIVSCSLFDMLALIQRTKVEPLSEMGEFIESAKFVMSQAHPWTQIFIDRAISVIVAGLEFATLQISNEDVRDHISILVEELRRRL